MPFKKGQSKIGGRTKGTLNKLTEEVRKLAKQHGPDAIKKLATLMESAEDERAQVAAAKEILDRAYGKSSGMVGVDPENNNIRVTIIGDDAKL